MAPARFVFEMDSNGDFDIYDTHPSGIGRVNAIGWVDKYRKLLFEKLLNNNFGDDASIMLVAGKRIYGEVTNLAP